VETVTAVALITGAIAWIRNQGLVPAADQPWLLMMATLFGLGFIVIGGEWFQMWRPRAGTACPRRSRTS